MNVYIMNKTQQTLHKTLGNAGFSPVKKETHDLIKKFNTDNLILEMTACTIVTWANQLNSLYIVMDGYLIVANFFINGKYSFYILRSETPGNLQKIIDCLFGLTREANLKTLVIWPIEERFLDNYRNLNGYKIETVLDENWSEYVYSAESFLDTSGQAARNKRRLVNKYDKQNVAMFPLTKENISVCLDMEYQCCSTLDCKDCLANVGCPKKAVETMVDIYDNDVYQGIFSCLDGVPCGYLIFEKASDDLVFFHYAATNIPHFCVYLYYSAVRTHFNNYKKINLASDMGLAGLRLFKKQLGKYEPLKIFYCNFYDKR